jgi:hypothetical protein
MTFEGKWAIGAIRGPAYGPYFQIEDETGEVVAMVPEAHLQRARCVAALPEIVSALRRAQTRLYVARNNGLDVPPDDIEAIDAVLATFDA